MSKVIFKINKEMKIPHSFSNRVLNKMESNSISPIKDNNFKKITSSGIIGTSGLSPVIIYKKSLKRKENKEKYKFKRQIKNTNYISDGGLKKKLEKFNNGIDFISSPISMSQNKTTKNKYNKNHNIFFEEKQKEKELIPRSKKYNLPEKKLFSKTVRESNKRPIFPKNNEKMKNGSKTKNGFGVKYKNLHEVNKNQEEDENNYQEKKFQYINQLYENGIANELRKYQIEKKMTPKEMFNERKIILLKDNGIELENELNNIEEENMNEDANEEEISKNNIEHNLIKSKTPSNHNLFRSQIDFNHNMISLDNQSMSPKIKKIYKQPVNQFEFIHRIKKEQQKLSTNNLLQSQNKKINNKNSISSSLNDSFRHKNKNNEKKILKNNYINNKDVPLPVKRSSEETQSTNDNYPYSHKKSHRSTEELLSFIKSKRIKEKENKKSQEIENNKKLFVRFKNLYNLSMKDLTEDQYKKISPRQKGKLNKSKSSCNYDYKENSLRKKREANEYYIGSEHSLKNNSTLVDQGEYFLHILESQQLLVNSKLKRIEDLSDTESNEEEEENEDNNNENNNDSKLNISKEKSNKITENKSKKTENSSVKTTKILNKSNNYDDLKLKINNILNRVNKVFNMNNTSNNNSDTSNNIINSNKSSSNTPSNKNNEIQKNIVKDNNPKELKQKAHDLNIDLTNVDNKANEVNNSEVNTKEKNVPSLSHIYTTNSNPNKKIEIEIEPRAVLNLVEIIKFIIQRKTFVKLYESYINHSIFQQYNIAFSYFVAICKHYPFRKIEEYANYRTYNFAFRQLFKPFTRKAYKYFINCCYTKRKIEYLVLILTKLIKLKIMEKIYLYNQFYDEDNQRAFKIIIMKILSTLIRPHLKESFNKLRNNIKKLQNKKEQKSDNNKKNSKKDKSFKDDNNENEDKKNNYLNKNFLNEKKNLKDGSNEKNNIDVQINDDEKNNEKQKEDKKGKIKEEKKEDIKEEIKKDNKNFPVEKEKEKLNNNKKEPNNEEKKRNIKIEIDDLNIIKNENFNKHSTSEIDVSAEKDNKDIDWEYNLSTSENKNKELEAQKNKENDEDEFSLEDLDDNTPKNKLVNEIKIEQKGEKDKKRKKSDEDYDDFDLNLSMEEIEKDNKKNEKKQEEKKEKENFIISENKPDKSRNSKQENKEMKIDSNEIKDEEKNISDKYSKEKETSEKENKKETSEINEEEEKKEEENIKIKLLTKNKKEIIDSIKDPKKLSEELTEEIIQNFLLNEIKSSKKKLIPGKKFKFDKFDKMNNNGLNNSLTNSYGSMNEFRNTSSNLSKEFTLGNLSQLSLHDDLISLNDSLMSNYSAFSVFNKTVKDKKKEHSLKLYLSKIAPKLIKLLYKEIVAKYPLIYKNISKPLKNNSDKFMMSLALQDSDMLRDNYRCLVKEESIEKIIDKEKILKQFSPINKNIRNKDNVVSDNFYDNILNDCIIDTAIELIYKERFYGKNGNPFKWSSRNHELAFKFNENEPKIFATYICKKIMRLLRNKIGLINENYDYMSPDQINMEKDRRLVKVIQKDLNDNEYFWNNLELEETQLKVEATESILEQLYNEIIEILEHIQFSRIRPELYQNKSIYACEEIPKLSFQQTTTEDMNGMGEGDDNVINI